MPADSVLYQFRSSLDKKSDTKGVKLIDFADLNDLFFMNGRTRSDYLGNFTHISSVGNTVIDYAICNMNSLRIVDDFCVIQLDTLSDHFPLSVTLRFEIKNQERIKNSCNLLKWNKSLSSQYQIKMLSSPKVAINNNDTVDFMNTNILDTISEVATDTKMIKKSS